MSSFVYYLHSISNKLNFGVFKVLSVIISKVILRLIFSCEIGVGAKMGRNVTLGYGGLGIVIHGRCKIGNNVSIASGVTIGGTSGVFEVPVIEDDVIIGTGAKIIGPIVIGSGSVIGANCVVINSIPKYSLVVGVPGKVIKSNINIKNYR